MSINRQLAMSLSIIASSTIGSAALAEEPISLNPPIEIKNLNDGLKTPSSKSLNSKLLNSSAGSTFVAQSVNAEPAKTNQKAGALNGKITDQTKEHVIKDARVVLSKIGEEHKRYHTESRADGTYTFPDVEPGEYDFTISAAEMLSTNQKIAIAPGESKILDIAMEDLDPVETLRITGKRTLIHPESIGSTTNIDHRYIYEYKSGNDLRQLIESTPGIMNDSYGNIITRGEHNAINYELDGVVIPEAAGVLQQTQPVSPRSLQNMKVDIGGYEASDGGGPLGAIARMKSLPIDTKPNFLIGQQIGGPLAGSIYYNTSGAFSQNPDSKLYNLRFSSSGQFRGTSLRLAPGTKDFVGNAGADINTLSSLVWKATTNDTFKFDLAINESFPCSHHCRNSPETAEYVVFAQDRQDYFIASWKRKGEKFFDELNLHLLNGSTQKSFKSSPAFDPAPVVNADQPIWSLAATAQVQLRLQHRATFQNSCTKRTTFKAGFLSEVRPVRTQIRCHIFQCRLAGLPGCKCGSI
ncbi:MAG: carboxypeptidase-like regulatory domain-containing protein [Candidatus Obscuribacterales bacterium]